MAGKATNHDKEMAAWLRSRGIFHGKRTTSTHVHTPHPTDPPGTARFQRMVQAIQDPPPKRGVGTRNPKGIR